MKTSELKYAALDWVVAICEGWDYDDPETPSRNDRNWKPSIKWHQGGPIIEREKLAIWHGGANQWISNTLNNEIFGYGSTPLEAAMRCYVASKLGSEVEIPEELT